MLGAFTGCVVWGFERVFGSCSAVLIWRSCFEDFERWF